MVPNLGEPVYMKQEAAHETENYWCYISQTELNSMGKVDDSARTIAFKGPIIITLLSYCFKQLPKATPGDCQICRFNAKYCFASDTFRSKTNPLV